MSHWNHRVVRREFPDAAIEEERVMYAIHEAYYHDSPPAITTEPLAPMETSVDDLRETLHAMLRSLDKPALDYETREEIAPVTSMRFDRWGLGYTREGDSLRVHYPYFDKTGAKVYGAGIPFDPHPEILANENLKGERAQLWREMLAATTSENRSSDAAPAAAPSVSSVKGETE